MPPSSAEMTMSAWWLNTMQATGLLWIFRVLRGSLEPLPSYTWMRGEAASATATSGIASPALWIQERQEGT